MILITGATGHLGKATIDSLLEKGIAAEEISALVRDETKAAGLKAKGISLKTGDYNDYPSLVAAFKGADKLLLISGNELDNRSQQHLAAVRAAKEAGVQHIFYTSFERKNESETSPIAVVAKSHLDTEKEITASGLIYTIFRNNLYLEMLPVYLGDTVLESGIFLPAGDGKTAFTSRLDMAEGIAATLASPGHENKIYSFTNTEAVSMDEVAEIISKVSGKQVSYLNPSEEEYVSTLKQAGVPETVIGILAAFSGGMRQGEFEKTGTDLEELLGRKLVSVREFLSGVYA